MHESLDLIKFVAELFFCVASGIQRREFSSTQATPASTSHSSVASPPSLASSLPTEEPSTDTLEAINVEIERLQRLKEEHLQQLKGKCAQ